MRRTWPVVAALVLLAVPACTSVVNRVTPTSAPSRTGAPVIDASKLWSMAPRAGAFTTNGVTEDAGDFRNYPVTPTTFTIRFDASSVQRQYPTLSSFQWMLDGHTVATGVTGFTTTTLGPHLLEVSAQEPDGVIDSDTKSIAVTDRLVVSMGDSIASGEGNPDVPGTNGTGFAWENQRCDRSGRAYGSQASQQLQQQDPQVSVTYVSVACSGAGTGENPAGPILCTTSWDSGSCEQTGAAGILRPYPGIHPPAGAASLPAQIDAVKQLVGSRPIDDLVISVGGNDVDFSGIAADCAAPATECNQDSQITNGLALDLNLLGRVGGGYDQLAQAIDAKLNVKRVWITTVYDPTTNTDGSTCPDDTILSDAGEYSPGLVGDPDPLITGRVSQAEASWVSRDLIGALNNVIVQAAARNGWNVIGSPADGGTFAARFSGHGYCAADPWVVKAAQSAQIEGPGLAGSGTIDTDGTLHPNAEGTAQYASLTANRLGTGGPKLTLSNSIAFAALDCAGSDGWLSGSRPVNSGSCAPGVGFTVDAENPPRQGVQSETDGVYLTGPRMPEEGPQLSFDGQPVAFDRGNPTKWTCAAPGLTCEVDPAQASSGQQPSSALFYFTLRAEGTHTFDLKVGNGLGVTSEIAWVSKTDWTPPTTTASLEPGTSIVRLEATDALSGVAATYDTVNGGSTAPAPLFGVTLHDGDTIAYWSTDKAGNIETHHQAKLVNGALVNQP